ncbi:hypothetical protein Q4488_16135 [Amphritea sp. 1_MG-2023]|uniref:hypothetical protein n=1 Tax=Amphritea sp. 1_MG-2023 TaxID=3062670 RepID=UPI0026E482E5|nr:hypothetical protein [Amphritea sp. 1_MG-2023]MDO6564911.1 hypothetical protein [Amphritea sp. 1_MG-2023]
MTSSSKNTILSLTLISLAFTPLAMAQTDVSTVVTSSEGRWEDKSSKDDGWGDDSWDDSWDESGAADSATVWHGFFEAGLGNRISYDPALNDRFSPVDDATLADFRVRLETSGFVGNDRYAFKADVYADGVEQGIRTDLREASYTLSPGQRTDLKLGQQVLTWGTGDLLFLNDLFPKDWQSFFAGRDTEYLKAPVVAAKASYYGETASIDLVWMPDYTSDRYINGDRFSWFSSQTGSNVAAPQGHIDADEPSNSLANGEFATRVYGSIDSTEWALYGYRGFQKQPNGLDSAGNPVFSRLSVLGASVRGNLGVGLANAEVAWHMAEDNDGSDPYLPNSQFRFLLGYERELLPRLTLGLQYYLEQTLDYAALETASSSSYNPEEYRYLYTTRLNYRMWQDNLVWSLFAFYSPSDDDHYLRPSVSYRYSDNLSVAVGANIFEGEKPNTFFGQFEDASNVYARIRYAF